jgi:hypothetical protein
MKRTVVIGAGRRQLLPAKVCEWTVRASTPGELEVVHTYDHEFGTSELLRKFNKTGFSFVRFATPELAKYQGRAIYIDSDMLVLRDLAGIFKLPFGDAAVLRHKEQTAVLLFDCEKLTHWKSSDFLSRLEAGDYRYKELMETLYEPRMKVGIPDQWNHLDAYHKEFTAILHYTDMAKQPWLYEKHYLAHLWYNQLRGAVRGGLVTRADVEAEIRAGHVGKWVLAQVPEEAVKNA